MCHLPFAFGGRIIIYPELVQIMKLIPRWRGRCWGHLFYAADVDMPASHLSTQRLPLMIDEPVRHLPYWGVLSSLKPLGNFVVNGGKRPLNLYCMGVNY